MLEKVMLRFSEDHFKNYPFVDFSAGFQRKATPLHVYELGKDGGDHLVRLCFG